MLSFCIHDTCGTYASLPFIYTPLHSVGFVNVRLFNIAWNNVDLPLPTSPIMPMNSPLFIVKEMFSNVNALAFTSVVVLLCC